MSRTCLLGAIILAGLTVGGCEKKEEAPTPPPAPPAAQVPATPAAPAIPNVTVPSVAAPTTVPSGVPTPDANTMTTTTPDAQQTQQAQTLIEQANGYIKDANWDKADKTVTQLEGMKNLPPAIESQIPALRKAVDDGKKLTGGGLSVPGGIPAMGSGTGK